jgi:sulfate adenylyltransferase subunit 2
MRDNALIMVDDDRLPLHPGERPQIKSVRFRTLGCYPLTGGIESTASSVRDIVRETINARHSERFGRAIDFDGAAAMERKKQEGYF